MKKLLHLLSVVAILTLGSTSVFAQSGTGGSLGDGDDPYLGTTHNYKVTKDGGTIVWAVLHAGDSTDASADVTLGTNGGENIDITWNTAGDYIIEYTETLNGCSTKRILGVTVHANSFYLYLADNSEACNSEEGNVLDWGVYETKSDVKTELTFTVNMTKDSGFSIDNYQFTGDFVLPTDVTIADAADVTVDGGTKTNGTGNGNFTVSATATDAATSGVVTIKVLVSGKVTDGGNVTLNLTNGKATKGSTITPDNTLLPASSDRAQVVVLKPLPGSTNISF
ncbi:hypothetical protein EV201_2296 [Ancylomarina subtilis]|uniref:Uncharacterized protein n=1 Tax=Ancylomarina subtilis TaxID=1639035 RepID=A0A4Q7VBA2_9BACT|nr:hypothetical protein [Ancylomarina subtilis]RZT93144.1 hypothetical protein EV201_2296 [Ancylomarina subtilis]